MEIRGMSLVDIASLAVKLNDINILKSGFDKIFSSNIINDPRDIITVFIVYYDAAKRINLNPDIFFKEMATVYPDFKEQINNFIARSSDLKDLKASGYRVVYNPDFNYL